MQFDAHARRLYETLRDFAVSWPEAVEEFPWGHSAVKVAGKIFVSFGSAECGAMNLSVKLPHSADVVLALPFAAPTRYGLGKSGWVTMRLREGECPPPDMLRELVAESYRAIAPKRCLA
jgi:predicted DNA-binding protein (MmcQ/YjbR family)